MRPENVLQRHVSLFNNARQTDNPDIVTIGNILNRIKSDYYKTAVEKLRSLDTTVYKQTKINTPAFTISVLCKHRQSNKKTEEKLIYHTGLIQVDIDDIPLYQLKDIKETIKKDPYTAFCFISLSGKGIKAAVRTEIEPRDQKRAFKFIKEYYQTAYNIKIDEATKDLFRLCFVSYDPDTFINHNPMVLNIPDPIPGLKPAPATKRTEIKHGQRQQFSHIVLNKAISYLDKSAPGNRHDHRIKCGRLLGGYIAGGLFSEYEAFNGINEALKRNTDNFDQALKDIKDGIEYGKSKPITPDQMISEWREWKKSTGQKHTQPETKTQDTTAKITELPKFYEFTEIGNTDRFLDTCKEKIIYHGNTWFFWDGTVWKPDQTKRVFKRIESTVRAMLSEGKRTDNQDLIKWSRRSSSYRSMSAINEIAASRQTVSDIFDKNPLKITCLNKTIDLSTGHIYTPKKSDYITKQLKANHDPVATCPNWLNFLDMIFDSNTDTIAYVQKAVGLSITGLTRRVLYICYGKGNNGKSMFTKTLLKIIGDYGTAIKTDTLFANNDNRTFDLAQLKSKRFVSCSESTESGRLAEARVKQITGGDPINAEEKYKSPFVFDPEFTIWLSTNHKPRIKGTDQAIWDRIKLIPFTHRITPEEQKPFNIVETIFNSEKEGILNWILAGVKAFLKDDITTDAPDILKSVAEYRDESDTIGQFLKETCDFDLTYSIENTRLYKLFVVWSENNKEIVLSHRRFSQLLSEREGIKSIRADKRLWKGIAEKL